MGGRRPAASFLTSSSRHSGSVSGEREEDWQGFEGGTEFVDEFLGLVQNREDGFFEALSRHSPLISADCPRGLNVGIRVFEDGTARCMDSVPHTEGGSCVMDQDCDQEGFLTCSRNAGGEEGEERRCVCPETSLGSISGGSCVLSDVLKKKLQECERHCNTSDGSRCVRAFHPSHPPASPSSSDRDRFVCQKPSASEKFLSGCRRCSATQMARSGFCADREHSGKVQEGEPSCECPKQNLPSEATTLFWKPGGTGCVERGAAFGLFREKCAPTVEGERERERRGAAEQEEEEELERDPRLVCNAGKGLVCADTGVCKCDPSQHLQPEWDPSFQVCTDRIPAGMSGQCLHDRDCDLLQGLNCDSATLTCLKPSEEEGSTDQAPVCSPPCETKDEVCARGRNARRGRVSASTGVCIPWGESKRQCAKCWGPDLRPSDGVSCVEVEGRWECVCKGVGARWNAASRVCEGPSHGEECVPPTLAPQESGGVLPCSAGAWLKCSAKNPSASSPSGEEQLGVCVCDESKGVDIRWNADRERCADEVPHGIGGDCLDSRDCDRRKGLVCSRGSGKCVCGETAEGEDEGGRLEFVEIRETPEGGCAVNEFYSPRFPSSAKERGKRLIAEGVRLGRENDDFEAAKRHAVTHKGTRELESQGAFACEEMDENVSNEIEEGEKSAVRGACGANLSLVGCHRTARLMGLSPSSCFRELNSQHESEFWPHPAFREEKEEACAQCRHGQMCVEETLEEAVEGSISVWRCEEACERAEGEAMRKIKMKDGRCLTLGHGERCEEDRDCDMEAGLLCRGLTGGHESLCLCGASAVSSDRHVSFNEALKTCIAVKNLLGKGIECNSSSDCTSPLLCLSKLEKVLGLSEGSQKEREGHIGLESSGGTKRTCECPPRLGGPLRRDKKTGLETTAVQLKFDEETGGCFSCRGW
uniref:Uncharacterized protein n=1 Tax=Chromera velia CCMP2878 TaxID=1169474 RepID=A0A0G4F399_9ALVE|eukprot:Cvel_15007.t1-p1 / transcript=Cvel_15007.t1 / gene=Cvel_15007 / organism=Chromera_velia_CCMP2878 / gene_product=Platelet endothelial aggregation receptor 1, putative / transcript_product=Platelet endothelial aggregation receptor 1, putative / location=Cvel_scaffold1092:12823-20589(+) / protein_length=930 / sequence_SO=supercontig / SO=protein_coding / is_pseudo=false